jgi:predicted kinase
MPDRNPAVQPVPPICLLLMKGHPATGKSTLAQGLARRLRWPLIDKDDVKDHTLVLPNGNTLAYTILWQIVARQLDLGLSVIADSPLSYPTGYATGCTLAAQAGTALLVVETTLDEAEWRSRLDARSPEESTHKIRGWNAMQAQLEIYNGCWEYSIEPQHHLRVDASLPVADQLQIVFDRLSSICSVQRNHL